MVARLIIYLAEIRMTKQIPLSQGLFATVDDDDYEYLAQFKWYATRLRNVCYAVRHSPKVKGKQFPLIKMHRVVANAPDGLSIDHINGDGLDNRKINLRVCTTVENGRNRGKQKDNTSGYKGVTWHKRHKKWYAQIKADGRNHFLGHFYDPIDAALAYDKAARELHGEFAKTNF